MSLADDGRPLSLTWHYTPREIVADGVIHGLGVVLGLAGAVALVTTAVTAHLGLGERAAVVVYATALVLMLGVSALYNLYPVSPRKWLLRRADHALIYLMIAGTYTPLVALVGSGPRAYALLAIDLGRGPRRHRREAAPPGPLRSPLDRALPDARLERPVCL
jgi:hemolysin III